MHRQEPSGVSQSSGSVQGACGPVISTNSPAMPSTLTAVGSAASKPGAPASASARSRTVGPTRSGTTPKAQGSPCAVSTIQKPRKAAPWSLSDCRIETVRPVVARPSQPFGTVTVIGTGNAEVVVYVPAVSGPSCRAAGEDAGLDVDGSRRARRRNADRVVGSPEHEQRAADQQHADRGGRGDAGDGRHGDPPRDAQVPLLWCPIDLTQGGLDHLVGRPGRAGLDPRPSGAFERAVVGHASRPSWATGSGSAARASRSPAMA